MIHTKKILVDCPKIRALEHNLLSIVWSGQKAYFQENSHGQKIALGKGSKKKKKKVGIFQLCRRPPLPPLKLENIQFFFFYMTRRANFFYQIFRIFVSWNIQYQKIKIFKKKILYCVGAGTPRSLATQPTLGRGGGVLWAWNRTEPYFRSWCILKLLYIGNLPWT